MAAPLTNLDLSLDAAGAPAIGTKKSGEEQYKYERQRGRQRGRVKERERARFDKRFTICAVCVIDSKHSSFGRRSQQKRKRKKKEKDVSKRSIPSPSLFLSLSLSPLSLS
jgi:hypothetical protein